MTIRPQRALSMSISARRVQWKAPVRLVSTTAVPLLVGHADGQAVVAHAGVVDEHEHGAEALAHLVEGGAARPRRRRRRPARRRRCARRDRVQPSSRSRSTIAAPIPRVPPVTTAQPAGRSGADMRALLPATIARAPHEAGAEGGQRRRARRAQAAVALGAASASGIDADDVLATRSRLSATRSSGRPSSARRGLEDPGVGLVGDEQVEVVERRGRRGRRRPRVASTMRRRRGGRPRGPPCAASARRARRRAGARSRRRSAARRAPQPRLVGGAPRRRAPAPSPNSTAVPRSSWSVMRESASAPQTSTRRARPLSISAAACSSAYRKPAQAALTSLAPRPRHRCAARPRAPGPA